MAHRYFELSALATAVMPELEVVEAGRAPVPTSGFESALVRARDGQLLLVQRPESAEAAREQRAELRAIAAMTEGIRSRLPFAVPRVAGAGGTGEAQVAVTEFLAGSPPDAAELAPGSGLLADLGRAIAAVHALPKEFAAAADLPRRSPTEARESADALIEQAKGTGRLPASLERRWLAAVDDPSLWQFQPCVSHGGLDLDAFLSVDAELVAISDWSDLRVGDPARDLRWVTTLQPAAATAIVNAYTEARGASVDRQLRQRANLYAELALARWLIHAVTADDELLIADAERLLDELVGKVHDADSKPLVHETLPVLDLAEVRELLKESREVRANALDGPGAASRAEDSRADVSPREPSEANADSASDFLGSDAELDDSREPGLPDTRS